MWLLFKFVVVNKNNKENEDHVVKANTIEYFPICRKRKVIIMKVESEHLLALNSYLKLLLIKK